MRAKEFLSETIRKIGPSKWRLYSKDGSKNLGTFSSLSAAKKHEREVQYFKSVHENSIKLSDNNFAKAWIDKVYSKFPSTWQNNHVMTWGEGDNQQFAMFELVPSVSKKNAVEVKWFQAYPLRQGVGSKAMQALQSMAREDGVSLTLYPWDKGQVSQSKLTKFYKIHGFKPTMKGSKNMYWDPNLIEDIVEFNGLQLDTKVDGANVDIRALASGKQVGYVVFDRDGNTLVPDDLAVDERFQGQGIAKTMYDYVKSLGFKIEASPDQTEAGKGFWEKHRGEERVWESDISEAPLADYVPLGFDSKGTQFKPVDKRLIQHPVNYTKTLKFFENTPYNFRLFFNNNPRLRNYREMGPASPEQIKEIFGTDAEKILENTSNAITIVFIGNYGADPVMMTPWIMAHRFGHAIQAGVRSNGGYMSSDDSSPWRKAETYFFKFINSMLEKYYGKAIASNNYVSAVKWDMTPEYNALFNSIGTQRSSRENRIKRPYEFLYEMFAQYLKDGHITLNPAPVSLSYGRKAWGNPTKYMALKSEFRDDDYRASISEEISSNLDNLFGIVLKGTVGKVYVM